VSAVARNLDHLSNAAEIVTWSSVLAEYEIDGITPGAVARPHSVKEISEVIRIASAEKLAIIACGGKTKLAIGAVPARYDLALDVSCMSSVLDYEPRDLTLGVEPGITFAELSKILAAEKQFLPLAPPFADRATIGGVLAANSASPLRQAFGGPRDFVLGMEFVTGYGAQSKSGGRVVKNVTGYDLHKGLIGSFGTLAVITRVNFKTFPLPPAQAAFSATFEEFAQAYAFCAVIANSPLEPQAVEVLSPEATALIFAAQDGTVTRAAAQPWFVHVLAAGNEAVVERHARDLRAFADSTNAWNFAALDAPTRTAIFNFAAEFPRIGREARPAATIFRIAALPATMPALIEQLYAAASRAAIPAAALVRPSGPVYFAFLPEDEPEAAVPKLASLATEIFRVVAELGARAFIEFAPKQLKSRISPWGPEREDLELMRRVKKVFDPENVLSPGRFAGGI
jgi:glycolate oxidase FAD binding subunit